MHTYLRSCATLVHFMSSLSLTHLYVHLKPKTFKNLEEMAREADLFAEARGGVYSCVAKGQRENKDKTTYKNESSRPGNKPEIKCRICGKPHLTYKCWNNPDRKVASSAEVLSDGGRLVTDSSVETNSMQMKGDNAFHRGRGSNSRGFDRGNNHGYGRGVSNKSENASGGGHQFNFCKIKGPKVSSDGIEALYQSKVDISSHSDANGKEGVCYFLKSRLPTAPGTMDGQKVVVLRDIGCTGVVVRKSLVSEDQLIGKESTVTLIDETMQRHPLAVIDVDCLFFQGQTEALCMDDTLYDLVIGNIDGSRLPDMSHFSVGVVTRAQAKQDDKTYRKLKVPDQILSENKKAFQDAQMSDPKLEHIRRKADSGVVTKSRGLNRGETRIIKKRDLLYRHFTQGNKVSLQLIVPTSFREKVLKLAHESLMAGHLGIRKTLNRVVAEFFWPGVCGDVTRFCKSCDICQRTIQKGRVTKVPLGKLPLIDTPFKRVAVDIVGPIEPRSDKKSRYILTMIDYATRYPEAVALPSIETERIAEALVEMFSRVGVPDEMLTDCGSQFTSEVMKEVARLLSLQQLTTSVYHPMCNGLIERVHATLKQMLRRMCAARPKDWDRYLPALLFAIREVPQESLGFSPFELLYGRNVRGPMAILREL